MLIKELVHAGMLGRKSGKGLFCYTKGTKKHKQNADAINIIKKYIVSPKQENTIEVIQQRLISIFVNEAVLCLQDGILINGPIEGDIGAVFGLGFPPYLGGKIYK